MASELAYKYLTEIRLLLDKAEQTQMDGIVRAGKAVAEALAGGHTVWVFGAGHSHMLGE